MRDLTPEELDVLRHSLGTGENGRNPSYRNHFVTGEGSTDHPTCMQLVDLGLMQRRSGNALSGGDDVFTVTATGRAAESAQVEPAPKLSAGQRRYRAFLAADSGLTFGQWLTSRGAAHA
ncbi:hypothetical protein ST27_10110 [Xanthomonas phaseoli pv. phaseoli]|uniref:hypothetical protein n=1 Tax=Xanthomonas phaseoli TaxID=1985254 RepID=UPI0005958F10|nr:hypothetical protein [Xanthomonas phaseoli]KIJ00446.1 hypothetical protein ST27_10110 [Xanthomonas phaseoli pv. phaseoli]UZB30965.1 hypothetical protein OM951_11080 [Xanthomonas phaseoli pv. phaseoli]